MGDYVDVSGLDGVQYDDQWYFQEGLQLDRPSPAEKTEAQGLEDTGHAVAQNHAQGHCALQDPHPPCALGTGGELVSPHRGVDHAEGLRKTHTEAGYVHGGRRVAQGE